MGTKTVLSLVQSYARQRGLPVPTALFAATDTGTLQLLECLNKAGRDIVRRRGGWISLNKRKTFACAATEDQGVFGTLMGEDPAGIVADSLYNDTMRLPINGPLTLPDYQSEKVYVPTGPFQEYALYNGHLFILGTVTAGHTISVMYKSKNWLQTAVNLGGSLAEVAADTNVSVFGDDLMLLALDYMWRKEKDLDYQAQLSALTMALLDADGEPSPIIYAHGDDRPMIKPGIIVPSGNWTT